MCTATIVAGMIVRCFGGVTIDALTTIPSPPRESSPWMVNLTLAQSEAGPPAEGQMILKLVDAEQRVYSHWTINNLIITPTPRKVGWWLPPRISTICSGVPPIKWTWAGQIALLV